MTTASNWIGDTAHRVSTGVQAIGLLICVWHAPKFNPAMDGAYLLQ